MQVLDARVGGHDQRCVIPAQAGIQSAMVTRQGTLFASDLHLSRSLDGGQNFDSPIRINEDQPISHSFSQAIKAYAPDVAVSPTGDVVVIWHEEQFPAIKTVVQPVRLDERR